MPFNMPFGEYMLYGLVFAIFYATVFTIIDHLRYKAYLHKFDKYVYHREV